MADRDSASKAPSQPQQPEKFFRVKFQAKSSPNEPDDVFLAVNGETLVIRRETEVVLPEKFLEVANHATYPRFVQQPNQPRKVVAQIKTYPYDRMGEATRQEFESQKADGTRQTRDAVAKYGFDHIPDVR